MKQENELIVEAIPCFRLLSHMLGCVAVCIHYEETIAIVGRHKAYIFYHESEQSFDVVIIPIFIDFTLPQLLHVREMQFYVKLYPTLTLSPRT